MSKIIIGDTKSNIFFKDNNDNIYICCLIRGADRNKVKDAIETKKDYGEIYELKKYIDNIYEISNNSILYTTNVPERLLLESPYTIFIPSEYEIKLYETLYKDFKNTNEYKEEKRVIQRSINDLLPIIHLLDNIKNCYYQYKNNINNLIKSIFTVLSDSSKSRLERYNIKQKIYYFTYYQHIYVDTNLEEKIINDILQHLNDNFYFGFNHYYDNYNNEIILITENPKFSRNQIHLFAEHRLNIEKRIIKIDDVVIIDKKKDQNIMEKLRKFIDKRSILGLKQQ